MNDAVLIAAIPVIGGIVIAVITVLAKNEKAKKAAAQPKDRMETIFDGYEAFIARQDAALVNKDKQLAENQVIINRMQGQLDEMRELLRIQREETEKEREINRRLHGELNEMRKQYAIVKPVIKQEK